MAMLLLATKDCSSVLLIQQPEAVHIKYGAVILSDFEGAGEHS